MRVGAPETLRLCVDALRNKKSTEVRKYFVPQAVVTAEQDCSASPRDQGQARRLRRTESNLWSARLWDMDALQPVGSTTTRPFDDRHSDE